MLARSVTVLGVTLLAAFAVAQPKAATVKPTTITYQKQNTVLGDVAAELSKSPAGVAVTAEGATVKAKCSVAYAGTPFWEALESVAAKTTTRLTLRDGGRTAVLTPLGNRPAAVSSVAGPFRVFAREVTGRALLEDGVVTHTVHLTAHWEPRMPVYRIDVYPKVMQAKDDRGTNLTVPSRVARDYPTKASHDLTIEQLAGLTRESKRIAILAGEFHAVVAEKILTVPFMNLAGKLPMEQPVEGVKVTLKRFEKEDDIWYAELSLEYPTSHPQFESFEEQKWLRDTRLRLVAPNGMPTEPDSEEVVASGRFVTAIYRFKVGGNPQGKGWSLVCNTPSPLVEVSVPFTLKDIIIP